MAKRKSKIKCIASILLALLVCLLAVVPASANSGPRYWRGTGGTGVVSGQGECPLVVEHETLTFDVPELPQSYYESTEAFLQYDAKVTAQYTFYNPTDMTVRANLLFPFGLSPDYGSYLYDEAQDTYQSGVDREKYGAQINGAPADTKVRYGYWDGGYDFDPVQALSTIQEDLVKGEFLHADLPMYIYTYSVSGVDSATYRAARVAASFDYDPARTRVMLKDSLGGRLQDSGATIMAHVNNATEIVLYVFGEDVGEIDWKFYENGGLETEISGQLSLTSKQSTTFYALAMHGRDPASDISAVDWFNAVLYCMEDSLWEQTCVYHSTLRDDWDVSSSLLAWYEYEIELAPGQRLTNTVTAPLYPTIDDGYVPEIYTYLYMLTPASLWADFGTLDIYINTPYYLVDIDASLAVEEFSKTETGYALHLDSLPEQDLRFTLSTESSPTKESNGLVIMLMIFVAAILGAGALVILAAVLVIAALIAFIMLLSASGSVLVWFWLPWIIIVLLILAAILVALGFSLS